MKKIFLLILLTIGSYITYAQTLHDSFQRDIELEAAIQRYNLTSFIDQPVNFICDTIEKTASAVEINAYLNIYAPRVKNSVIRKASETNNGFVQTYGVYKNEDAIYYIIIKLNSLSGFLEELVIEKNN